MGKFYSTHYQSEAMVSVGPEQVKYSEQEKINSKHQTEPLSLYRPIKSETYSHILSTCSRNADLLLKNSIPVEGWG